MVPQKTCFKNTYDKNKVQIRMEKEPQFRKKHESNEKKRDKGFIYASKRHVRIELENLQRQEKKRKNK
jgi:hypothetical protein